MGVEGCVLGLVSAGWVVLMLTLTRWVAMVLLVIRLIDLLVCLLTLGASIGIALTVLPLPWVVPAALLSVVGQVTTVTVLVSMILIVFVAPPAIV